MSSIKCPHYFTSSYTYQFFEKCYIWFPIAVSLCTCRRSNEEYYFYSTFERITSGEVPIRVMAEIL